jgi:hypothetical protein
MVACERRADGLKIDAVLKGKTREDGRIACDGSIGDPGLCDDKKTSAMRPSG